MNIIKGLAENKSFFMSLIMSQKQNKKQHQTVFAGIKRVFAGFAFFAGCLAVYFGISALLSHFLHDSGSITVIGESQEESAALPKPKQYLSANKSTYGASEIYFSAYFADHDPFGDLVAEIKSVFSYDKDFIAGVQKIHSALDSFFKAEIPEKQYIYADSDIHFTVQNKAYPFVVYQLVHPEMSEYMYYLGEENEAFFKKLETYLKDKKLPCSVHFEESFYYIQYKGQITHVIRLRELQERIGIFSLLNSKKSYITLILDDAGENLPLAKECMDLPYPVIFSIWPKATHSTTIAVLAHEKGLPVFLHQPMEAFLRNGKNVDIGRGGLYTSMSYEQIRDVLYENIMSIPYVQGMNNHMGSKFSSDETAVMKFYRAVQEIKPYFLVLDSLTAPQSKLYLIGTENEFLTAKRDFFIDNTDSAAAIKKELDRAYALSHKYKRIIIIGHVRKATVQALKEWKAYEDSNVIFSLPTTFF